MGTRPLPGGSTAKGHLAVDPDSEIITATTATPGNTGDAEAAMDLLAADLEQAGGQRAVEESDRLAVYGDAAYRAGELLEQLQAHDVEVMCKVQPASAPAGMFSKDAFDIDIDAGTVTCPGEHTVAIRPAAKGGGTAIFGGLCAACPLAEQCTSAAQGRTIRVGRRQRVLAGARVAQTDPDWRADYRATRPKVERKIGHLMRRRHGGRRARVRGRTKVAADFALLAAAVNLARLGVLGLTRPPGGTWVVAPN
jgi:hypothetical protein